MIMALKSLIGTITGRNNSRKEKSPTSPTSKKTIFRRRMNERQMDPPPPPYDHPGNSRQPNTQPNPFADQDLSLQRASTFRDVPTQDPYAALSRFDTVFLIDDSGSMSGSNWSQTSAALAAIVPVCTAYDSDGVDIHFLNNSRPHYGVRSAGDVMQIFSSVSPFGTTPTGARLGDLLQKYLSAYKKNRAIKPLNIICITDGEPTDPAKLEKAIVKAAKELDVLDARDRQVGIQFFQVGSDESATEALEELDNSLVEEHGVRDMVDTVSWKQMNGGRGLTGDGVLKAVMGAIDGKLDRKRKLY